MDPVKVPVNTVYERDRKRSNESFMNEPANPYAGATPMRPFTPSSQRSAAPQLGRPFTPTQPQSFFSTTREDHQNLVQGAAPLGGVDGSPPRTHTDGYGANRDTAR